MHKFKFHYSMIFFTEITSPLDQFEIRDILNLDILSLHLNLTNIGLYLTIGSLIIITSGLLATNYNKLVSNN
jgi:F-type H+-transporting ATPase subunit a